MVKEGIVLVPRISDKGIEVDQGKVEVIETLSPPISLKGVRNFLCHTGFYKRFIKDFSKIAHPRASYFRRNVNSILMNPV